MQEVIYLRPKKAGRKLKQAQSINQTVYIYGATGTGKTSLVRDCLGGRRTYEYFAAESISTEKLVYEEKEKQHIVVIDNLHTVTTPEERETWYPVLYRSMEQKNVWLILITRCSVPRWLMPLYVKYTFCVIEEKDLLLTIEEQELFLDAWNVHLTEGTMETLCRLGGGVPLIVKMMAMEMKRMTEGQDGAIDSDREALEQQCVEQVSRNVWDYLETYVYDQWEEELQEFLMEMSVVEQFDIEKARCITRRKNVEGLIFQAKEIGNFLLETDGIYYYRRALRLSMRRRLKRTQSTERIRQLYENAGGFHEARGEILEALKFYELCDDKESISRLLIENARKNPSAGYYFELRRFYLELSEEVIEQSAILMAGMSMLQSILMNEEESERWYQILKTYEAQQTGGAKKEARSMLFYLDIALPHRGIVHMVDLMKYAGLLIKERKIVLPEFSVTSNLPSQMNGGKDFCQWSKQDKELAASIGRVVELVLGKYGKAVVNLALAESFFEKGRDNYEVVALAERGRIQAEAAGRLEQYFVAVGILSQISLFNGYAQDSMDLLESFEKKAREGAPHLLPNIRALECRIDMYRGRTKEILEWQMEAPDENEEFCTMERFRYLTKVRFYIYNGKYDQAIGLLQRLLFYAEKMHRTYIEMEVRMLLAIALEREGNTAWKEEMQQCLTMAQEYHFVRLISREGAGVLKIVKADNLKWQDKKYKKQVLEECEKMAAFYPSYLKEQAEKKITLSPNALKVLRPQAEGYSTEKIAQLLGITVSTVKYHSHETYRKLGVTSKAAAVNEARNWKLL